MDVMYRVNFIYLLCEDVRRLQVTLKVRCLVGGLINNAQTVDSPDTLVAGPDLILAMWRAARRDPACLVSVPCVSLR